MSSFLGAASHKTGSIQDFLKNAVADVSIKYRAEKGRKHTVYIPCRIVPETDEGGNTENKKEIVALYTKEHSWTTVDGKYKTAVCLDGVIRKDDDTGNVLNDGTCPFCENINKAWDIYNYNMANAKEEMARNQITDPKKQEEFLKQKSATYRDALKAKKPEVFLYMLIVLYRTDSTKNNAPIIGDNGIPEFDLKVMKVRYSRIKKIQEQLSNSGVELADAEIVFDYPDTESPLAVVSQSTVAPIFESAQLITRYPKLRDAINEAVEKFSWEGIEKSFDEWKGMTTEAAQITVDKLFESWDQFLIEKETNPNARYLESGSPSTAVSLEGATNVATDNAIQAPPKVSISLPDANEVFKGSAIPDEVQSSQTSQSNDNITAIFGTASAPSVGASDIKI